MSSFEDFRSMSEHRERVKRQRKGLIITGVASATLLLLLVAGVVASLYNSDDQQTTREVHSTSKSVNMVCDSTDYKHACESSMSEVIGNLSSPDPKELLKAAVAVVSNEVARAFNHSKQLLNTADPMVKGAIEDCRQLYYDSKDELANTLDTIVAHNLEHLPKQSHELRTWLSAVMSYMQTCVDGFPEGELKQEMEKRIKNATELTSNALAIINEVASFMSTVDIPGYTRRLLADGHQLDSDGLPYWVTEGDRRVLKSSRAGIDLVPNVTVAKDGSGKYTTISQALEKMPHKYEGRYVIYVKEGVYEETVNLTRKMENVTMYGDGASKTIVTGSKNFVDGTRTYHTATFAAQGDSFMAIAMGFRNTAGAIKHQAVALRVQSDRSIFLNCRIEGYQDTLYAQTHRQFYRGCIISGTIDFIFGDAVAVFQKCTMVVRRPLDNQQNIVTAQGRIDRHENTGFVLHNCRIIPDARLKPDVSKIRSYLGRPWKNCSRTVIMESHIHEFIHPDGYMPWDGEFALKTLYYAEYKNSGDGANLKGRVKWPGFKVIERKDAKRFTVDRFVQGGEWLRGTGTPVRLGLYH